MVDFNKFSKFITDNSVVTVVILVDGEEVGAVSFNASTVAFKEVSHDSIAKPPEKEKAVTVKEPAKIIAPKEEEKPVQKVHSKPASVANVPLTREQIMSASENAEVRANEHSGSKSAENAEIVSENHVETHPQLFSDDW